MANDEIHTQLPWFSEHDITSRVSISDAIAAIEGALQKGHDPATDPARAVVDTAHGQLLLMPAESANVLGVKIASVAPNNPNRNLPRIQAAYLMVDSETITLLALFEGTALTPLRTPAVSAVAAKHLTRKDAANLLLFGAGPQARTHVDAVLVGRSIVAVEDRVSALREGGNIIMAIEEGMLSALSSFSIRDLANHPNRVTDHSRPSIFKSSGMAWEDLVVAAFPAIPDNDYLC